MTDGMQMEEPGRRFAIAALDFSAYHIQPTYTYEGRQVYAGEQVYNKLGPYKDQFDLIPVDVRRFGDGGGETPTLKESPQHREVYVPHFFYLPTAAQHQWVMQQLIDALQRAGADAVHVIETYNPSYRQDRRTKGKKESVAAKCAAQNYSRANGVYVIDPHFPQLEGFFDCPMSPLDLTEKFAGLILREHTDFLKLGNIRGCSTDPGGAKPTKELVSLLYEKTGQEPDSRYTAMVDKDRWKDREEVTANAVLGDVSGQNIIIREDVAGTGRTLAKSTTALKKARAKNILVACSYVGPSIMQEYLRVLAEEGVRIVTTDGIPPGVRGEFSLLSLPPIISRVITRRIRRKSVSEYMSRFEV